MKKVIFAATLTIALFSCKKNNEPDPSRTFFIGFSPWPYDNTIEAQNWMYSTITQYGDIISEHMEEGVPWPEAYSNSPFPQEYITEIESRLQHIGTHNKIILQISPLNITRNGIAYYRGTSPNQSLPSEWSGLALNDAKVKIAFLNYAKRMIQYFSPDYMILGVESNLLIRNNPSLWPQYVELQQYIFTELKKVYPSLQISVSFFCVPFFPEWSSIDNLDQQKAGLSELEPYVDFISFSVHPFMSGLLAETFPTDYLNKLFSYTTKPIAISESSYPAQVWQTTSAPIISFNGSQAKQANFLKLLFKESEKANAKFIIWFSVRDYDALWEHALNRDPSALPWRDTGLFDEAGNERSAFKIWEEWYNKMIQN